MTTPSPLSPASDKPTPPNSIAGERVRGKHNQLSTLHEPATGKHHAAPKPTTTPAPSPQPSPPNQTNPSRNADRGGEGASAR